MAAVSNPGIAANVNYKMVYACGGLFEVLHSTSTDPRKTALFKSALDWLVDMERRFEDEARNQKRDTDILPMRQHGLDSRAYVSSSMQSGSNTAELDTLTDMCIDLLEATGFSF